MAGYWKIEKTLIQEHVLTWSEAGVLADIQDWPTCTIEERAKRCGLTKKSIFNILSKLREKGMLGVKSTPNLGVKSTPDKVKKLHQNDVKSTPNLGVKSTPPPTPPYIEEHIGEQEEHCDESRAREEEFRQLGMVKKVDELAEELREEIRNGGSFITNTMQMYGLNPQQTEEYLGWFLNHLGMGGTTLKSRGDFRRHFTNWLGIQVREQLKRQQSNGNRYQYTPGADLLNEVAEGFAAGM